MKILLINPPIEMSRGEVVSVIAPLGLAYIAAVLEKDGHQVEILDFLALSWKNPMILRRGRERVQLYALPDSFIYDYLKKFAPEIVGISNLLSATEKESLKLAQKIKKVLPKTKVIVGGSNASVRPLIFIKDANVDFVCIGEGEETMRELVKNLAGGKFAHILGLIYKNNKGKVIFNPPRSLIADLNKLPFPAWHLLPMEEYLRGHPAGVYIKKKRVATMIASRGCPNGCSFCTNEKIWGRIWRPRSIKNVIEEIKTLKKKYQVEEIQFVDNNISVRKDFFRGFCQALKKEKITWIPSGGMAVLTIDSNLVKLMAESGCYALQFGIEHGDLKMQRRIGKIVPLEATKKIVKACHKYGIWAHGNFIVGLPGETMKSAYQSLDYAIKADLDSCSFFTALPLPGSRVYQEVLGNKKIDLTNLRFYLSKARCSELSNYQINKIIKTSFRKFMLYKIKKELNPLVIIKRLSQIHSFDDIRFYLIMIRRFVQIETI